MVLLYWSKRRVRVLSGGSLKQIGSGMLNCGSLVDKSLNGMVYCWVNADLNMDLTKALIEMINIKSYNEVLYISMKELNVDKIAFDQVSWRCEIWEDSWPRKRKFFPSVHGYI
jgi:hypothetical protein